MVFKIIYFKNSSGRAPVEDFLLDLKRINNPLAQRAFRALDKLKNRTYHREPLSKHLEDGLWEIRVKSENNILRILFTFTKGQIIILLHIFIKKRQKTPLNELTVARERLKIVKEQISDEQTNG